MSADNRVIGLMSGKAAKAYPAGILAQHGLVRGSPSGAKRPWPGEATEQALVFRAEARGRHLVMENAGCRRQ